MLKHIEVEATSAFEAAALALPAHAIAPVTADESIDLTHLPRDHPAWPTDSLSLSSRARALLAKITPVVVRVLTFWDHRVRAVAIGSARITIDPAGSYRLQR